MLALTYITIFYLAAILAPLIAPHNPNETALTTGAHPFEGPSLNHWFGTDSLGRDLFSRVLFSARTTLIFTAAVFLTGGVFLGLGLGLLSGYKGGWIDTLIMRVGEVLAGMPTLFLIIAIAAAFRTRIDDFSYWIFQHTPVGKNDAGAFVDFVVVVGATVPFAWVGGARIVRSQALYIREADYVLSAEVVGAGTGRVIFPPHPPGRTATVHRRPFRRGWRRSLVRRWHSASWASVLTHPRRVSVRSSATGAGIRITSRPHPHILLGAALPVVFFFFSWNLLGDALVDLLEPRTSSH